jgi:catechol 2,3-dioxygenase-like lactoylglutathione lyase family enzyme
MAVKRIVANIATDQIGKAGAFYGDVLGLEQVMDLGWIATFAAPGNRAVQVSFASTGGSGVAVPDLSVEVDDFDQVHRRVVAAGLPIEYGPVSEKWDVRRFIVRDPFGRRINIVTHAA